MNVSPAICRRRRTAAWLPALLLLLAGTAAPGISGTGEHPLPDNFGMVGTRLYRGAAPDAGQLRALAERGIGAVIDLRWTAQRGYGARVRQLGMGYFRIPLRPRSVPTEEELQRFFSLLESEADHPVYVHCRRGRHRTGLLLALYRVLRQGASREEALAEMQSYRFGRGHRRMADYFRRRAAGPAAADRSPDNGTARRRFQQ